MAASAGAYAWNCDCTRVCLQDNAAASILANPALANNPIVDRQLFLGFQADEPHKRHLKEVGLCRTLSPSQSAAAMQLS